jgi:hypothetical protein
MVEEAPTEPRQVSRGHRVLIGMDVLIDANLHAVSRRIRTHITVELDHDAARRDIFVAPQAAAGRRWPDRDPWA